ncbi:uncharacterized protein LOC124200968 isoform X3 [Daphnia pulex]|uniref:uncharacterized protein LOC124200968 isoform X2 n=1 Tax=Daphnia pulex TaxID=6669 RepID=UPI001EDF4B3B|nr:uncharacterized protein LOC124200968 isoform X2 [Daphnia pulex]XP_046453340.1 uncharacterized protein LOC124200968 isoform X3 [Daphnia pulex]
MKSFVALSALVLAVCVVSSQGKSFGNKNVNKNVNDNSNSDFDFLSSFLDSYLSQQEKKGKAAKAAKAVPASVPIASKSAVTTSTAINDESPASVIAVAISRSLPDTTTAQQQQQDQQSFEVEIGLADDEFVGDISAFDDSEQEESAFSAAQLKFFQSLMEA